jgi:hypothetical protein
MDNAGVEDELAPVEQSLGPAEAGSTIGSSAVDEGLAGAADAQVRLLRLLARAVAEDLRRIER